MACKRDTIGAPYPQVSYLNIQLRIKNIQKKTTTPESSKKWNLTLPHAEHYADATKMKWCGAHPAIAYVQM